MSSSKITGKEYPLYDIFSTFQLIRDHTLGAKKKLKHYMMTFIVSLQLKKQKIIFSEALC